MSDEAFLWWQPRYAEHGIATFPVNANTKIPAVLGYDKVDLNGSAALAERMDAAAFGYCPGKRSKITVLDIDSADEKMLVEALNRHGPTPLLVRTASGKFHAYYRHNGWYARIWREAA